MQAPRFVAFLALLAFCGAGAFGQAPTDRSRTLSLHSGVIDVLAGDGGIPAELKAVAADGAGEDYVVVKFPGPVSAAEIRALEERVERIYTYLPHDAFLVRLRAEETPSAVAAELGASWTGPYHPAYKIAPAVAAVPGGVAGAPEKAAKPVIVMLRVYPDADLDAVLERVELLLPGRVVGSSPGERFARVRLLLPPAEIAAVREALARIPEVFWIGIEPRRALLNDTTVWVAQSGTNGGQQTPVHDRGILGQGQIVGVLDTGVDADMCYFRDGVLGLPPQNPCNGGTLVNMSQRKVIAVDFLRGNECAGGIGNNEWDTNDHGSHVAGTIAGDNLANPLFHDPGDGMAPGAKLVVQDCGFQTDNCADCPGIGSCPVVDLNPVFQQAYTQGARIHTNSWGDDENNPVKGLYSAGSEDADQFMWNHKDFLLLFANGNDGPGTNTVGSPATAKNVVGVGATLRGTSANSMASFSSCGPTDDGRVKPDVTMPGSGIISANADNNVTTNNCGTKSSSGTSMASPGAAGSAALIRQYYTAGWYPSGSADPADAFTPSAALVKATLVNSATDMTNVAAIPSNCQGWGRVRLDDALHFSGEARSLFVEDDSVGFPQGSSGGQRTFPLTVASSSEPFKVTLTWTDFPSTPAAAVNLVNDLDLVVSGPGGTFLGNVFSGGQSQTGGSSDRRNTVEQVLLAAPTPGSYTVTVRSFTVPVGPQPFALVATGDLASGGCDDDNDCDDGLFCNGAETCGAGGVCQPGSSPCSAGESCFEDLDLCLVCLHDVDFESGAGGWTPGADTCTTGSFVVGTPDATDWQPGGGNPGAAFFTRPNPGGVGGDDVDGGTCEALSPVVDASATDEALVALDYFHGQRDAGGGAGDGFTIEVLNDGVVVGTLVAIGDVTSDPDWTSTATTVVNPGDLRLRVRASDGPSGGDIVEGGVDNVLICSIGEPTGCTTDSQCDDGLFCNGAERCVGGSCQAGADPCPGQACDESGDVCVPGGGCAHDVDFGAGAGGWTQGASTCTTGAFIVGTPDATTWQVGGGNPGQAFFTATNPGGLGTDDVDGGTCEALSPVVDCSGESSAQVSLDYFHGQRDAGGDPADGFTIEVLNDGVVVDTVVAIGDVTSNPAWTSVSTTVANPGDVRIRVRATDATASGDIVEAGIDNVVIAPGGAPPACTYEQGFESAGLAGWSNSPASTCTTGAYVQGNPTNPGGGFQIVGSHAGNGSLFTGVNTSAGADDVDGGNCVLASPALPSPSGSASTLSVWHWHGQRDNADDPAGDFFLLEYSLDGGSTWSTLAATGDTPSTAAWTNATASIPAGSDVRVRVQCSDGAGPGDLIECGIDDVSICN
jgi:hypothetical protein